VEERFHRFDELIGGNLEGFLERGFRHGTSGL
jgi:hypothetical protein